MKKLSVLIIVFISFSLSLLAVPKDSIETIYRDGEFLSHYQTKVKATDMVANEVAIDLLKDFHETPGNLFNWALKGLGLEEKKKNEVIFILKSSITDKAGVTHGKFDIIVPYFKTFNNVRVDAIVSKTQFTGGPMKVTANIIYSSLLLKYATGVLTIIPQKNNELLLITNVKIKFGWFFNIFITRRRYKSIVEWRIIKFTENMRNECEHRQGLKINHEK